MTVEADHLGVRSTSFVSALLVLVGLAQAREVEAMAAAVAGPQVDGVVIQAQELGLHLAALFIGPDTDFVGLGGGWRHQQADGHQGGGEQKFFHAEQKFGVELANQIG